MRNIFILNRLFSRKFYYALRYVFCVFSIRIIDSTVILYKFEDYNNNNNNNYNNDNDDIDNKCNNDNECTDNNLYLLQYESFLNRDNNGESLKKTQQMNINIYTEVKTQ